MRYILISLITTLSMSFLLASECKLADLINLSLLDQAEAYHQYGVCLENYDYNHQEAIKYYKKALAIREANHQESVAKSIITDEKVFLGIIKAHTNIGFCYKELYSYNQAEQHLNKAIEHLAKAVSIQKKYNFTYSFNADFRKGKAYHGLGQVFSFAKDITYAHHVSQIAIDSYKKAGDDYYIPLVCTDLSNLYITWSDGQNAKKYALKAINELNNIISKSSSKEEIMYLKYDLAIAKTNLGTAYDLLEESTMDTIAKRGYLNQSEVNFQSSINIFNSLQILYEAPEIIAAYNGLIIIKRKQKKYSEAERIAKKAISLINNPTLEDSLSLTLLYHNLGEVYNNRGDYEAALTNQETALNYLGKLANLPYQAFEYLEITRAKADALSSNGDYETAAREYAKAIACIDSVRLFYRDVESKFKLAEIVDEIFSGAVAVNYKLENYKTAFEYSEKSKVFTLLESTKHHKALGFPDLSEELERELELRRKIRIAEEDYKGGSIDSLLSIAEYQTELVEVMNRLYADENYRKIALDFSTVSVDEIQRSLLAENQVLLEYFVGEGELYIFILKTDTFEMLPPIPLPDDYKNQIGTFLTWTSTNTSNDCADSRYTQAAQSIYDLVISPIESYISVGERLLIIPDGQFNQIPFAALLKQIPVIEDLCDYTKYEYLAKAYPIAYCYSANMLKEMCRGTVMPKRLLACAPVYTGSVSQTAGDTLGLLQYSDDEIRAISIFYPKKNVVFFINGKEDRDTFISQSKQPLIIHFSGHAIYNDNSPDSSYLAFSDDQSIYAFDLYGRTINSPLFIFNGCKSGYGQIITGEGMMSLSRNFAVAGVESLISTLWSIDNKRAKELMTNFHKQLIVKKHTTDIALQIAQKKAIDSGKMSHPYFWAAHTPIGNMNLRVQSHNSQFVFIAISVLILLLIILYVGKKRSM